MATELQSVSETNLAERLVEVPDRLETIEREVVDLLEHLPDESDSSLLSEAIISLNVVAGYLTKAKYALSEYVNDEMWCKESSNAS